MSEEHVITVAPAFTLDRGGWWQASCSCGAYTSSRHAYPGRAEAAGEQHARAKSED